MKNVYLVPHPDATYEAHICATPPAHNAIFLTAEGTYPVLCERIRYDVLSERVYECETCQNRAELLELLNWCGTAYQNMLRLWDFDIDTTASDEMYDLYNSVYYKQREWNALYMQSVDDDPWERTVQKFVEAANTQIDELNLTEEESYSLLSFCATNGTIDEIMDESGTSRITLGEEEDMLLSDYDFKKMMALVVRNKRLAQNGASNMAEGVRKAIIRSETLIADVLMRLNMTEEQLLECSHIQTQN